MLNNKPRRYLRILYLWHRRIGIVAALLFLILSVTGIMLNHSPSLSLDKTHVNNAWLLNWYGIEAPELIRSFPSNQHYVSQIGENIFFDKRPLALQNQDLTGTIFLDGMVFVSTQERLLALTASGETIENQALPKILLNKVIRIGSAGKHLVIEAQGATLHIDSNMDRWQDKPSPEDIRWARPVSPPTKLVAALKNRQSPLSLERVVLDLHSGRLFGSDGVYVMDAAAIILLLLSLSGSFLWLQHHHRHRKNRGNR